MALCNQCYNKFNNYMQNNPKESKEKNNKRQTATNNLNPSNTQNKIKSTISDIEAVKILEEVERLLNNNENLEAINLLRALKDNMQGVKNVHYHILTIVNLGILYYQVGFLEEANEQFNIVIAKLKQQALKLLPHRNKDILRMKYETMLGKLELQVCILYSQLGKHDLALQHAKLSSKTNYNLIYDVLSKLYNNLNKLLVAKNYQKKQEQIVLQEGKQILNTIAILNHLINGTKDLKFAFAQKERLNILEEQSQITRKYGYTSSKIDIDMLYETDDKLEYLWIYKNKILDQIQLVPYSIDQFQDLQRGVTKSDVIQKITFLAISLYCYSTQTRFIQKQKNCDSHDVLDSEHWLSRSLEIAYSFMPAEAPILNQILTVHDRFHGLDKQTIPEDEEVTGFFKVLKPLSKPKSLYNSKNPVCSPIMIRIQADKVDLHVESEPKTHRQIPLTKNLIQFDQQAKAFDIDSITKNNKIRGISHGNKRVETAQVQSARVYASTRATIDGPLSINGNIRSNYVSKRFNKKKQEKIQLNYSQMNGKAIISQDLLFRPNSYEKDHYKEENYRSASEKKKKSLPTKKHDSKRRPNSIGATIKFQGLQLKGQKLQQGLESQIFQKMHNEAKILQATRLGGNVYINNNINLYISKNVEMNPFGQTFVRGQVYQEKAQQKTQQKSKNEKDKEKDLSRRQIFLNKRRANNFITPENIEL